MRKESAALLIVSAFLMLAIGGQPSGTTDYEAQAAPSPRTPFPRFNLVGGSVPSDIQDAKMAFVKPIFTDTAFNNAFYVFFTKYGNSNQTYITTDLNYLNVTIKHSWSWSDRLQSFLASDKAKQQGLFLGKNIIVIDDINVTDGGLFHEGKRVYDVLILGFTEYVTSAEYYAYKDFVARGGTIIILDSANFQAEVKYSPPSAPNGTGYMSLVKGKSWEFNGTHAWKSVYGRWEPENKNWIGSNYWFYWWGKHYDYFIANTSDPISTYLRNNYGERITSSYGAHEESILQNFTNTNVIGYWHFINASEAPNATIYPGEPVAAFQHRYMNGTVFRYGIMASDKIIEEEFLQAFLISAIRMALFGEVGAWRFPRDSILNASSKFYDYNGREIDTRFSVSNIISLLVTLNGTSISRGGVSFNLSNVVLKIYPKSGYSPQSISKPKALIIQGTETDETGLSWKAIFDTTVVPDGDYALEFDSYFVALVNNASIASQFLATAYLSIYNDSAHLRIPALVLLASSGVSALVFASYAYRKSRRTRFDN